MKNFIGKSTSKGHYSHTKTTHNYILTFIQHSYKKNDLPLDEINYSFIKKFEYYLLTETTCNHNGTMKHMQRFKKVLNWAIKNDYLTVNPFRKLYHILIRSLTEDT
jgi:hypothetical protein